MTVRPQINVEIYLENAPGPIILEGTILRLNTKVYNADGANLTYTWYLDRKDGKGYILVNNATNSYYDFKATRDSIFWNWKVVVTAEW